MSDSFLDPTVSVSDRREIIFQVLGLFPLDFTQLGHPMVRAEGVEDFENVVTDELVAHRVVVSKFSHKKGETDTE